MKRLVFTVTAIQAESACSPVFIKMIATFKNEILHEESLHHCDALQLRSLNVLLDCCSVHTFYSHSVDY